MKGYLGFKGLERESLKVLIPFGELSIHVNGPAKVSGCYIGVDLWREVTIASEQSSL